MVRRRYLERNVFEVLLPDGQKLWPEDLRRIDQVLDDEGLVDTMDDALGRRWPQSRRRGRPGTPADVVLRMLILKHLYHFSYEELEYMVRATLPFREFAHVGLEKVPDSKTILRIANSLNPEMMQQLQQRVVEIALDGGVSKGRRLRIDTTVVESNVQYPTDSGLLADGIRVITRAAKRVEELVGAAGKGFRDSVRSATRIARAMRMIKPSAQRREKLAEGYRKLVAIAKRVLREGQKVAARVAQRLQHGTDPALKRFSLEGLQSTLQETTALLSRVIKQTVERIFGGNTHVPDKVLSLFEPHTEAIRKGKITKPTEFGKMVCIQESDGGLITACQVEPKRVADSDLWVPAIEKHIEVFGCSPYLATADRGFYSGANEQTAKRLGVRRVCLPKQGQLSASRREHQRQRWFRAGLRWRVGSEGRISALKRRHGLDRCLYHGLDGMNRWVGFGVIAGNLLTIARYFIKKQRREEKAAL
jgi:IS5 family transposase